MKIITENNKKLFIGIFGMPNSGTTLLSSSIHCADNAFCLCEPHLSFREGRVARIKMLDKIGLVPLKTYIAKLESAKKNMDDATRRVRVASKGSSKPANEEVLEARRARAMANNAYEEAYLELKKAIDRELPRLKNGDIITNLSSINKKLINYLNSEDKYSVGGIKDCYWTENTNPNQECLFDKAFYQDCYDIILFIFREPRAMFLSQHLKGPVLEDGFISDYKSFYDIYNDLNFNNKFLINYESLCRGNSEYLNNVLKGNMIFDDKINLHPTSFATGSWTHKNLTKDQSLNRVVKRARTYEDFSPDLKELLKDSLRKIENELEELSFLWK